MLDTIPKDHAITQLIIAQMETYYDKCRGHYKCKAGGVCHEFVFKLIESSLGHTSAISNGGRYWLKSCSSIE